MNTGVLYYEGGKAPLAVKILKVLGEYRNKHGAEPQKAFVNPAMLDGTQSQAGIVVETSPHVAQNHIWLEIG